MSKPRPEEDYLALNRESWNNRTKTHINSKFYDNESFLSGRNSLNEIELEFLQNIEGKTILHLQCHFGQDTISLSRLGAKTLGVDLSDEAIKEAEKLNAAAGSEAEFLICDILSLPEKLKGQFDMVFTSYGTVGWLPDLKKWGNIVSHFLKPGGTFLMADFHPVVWMMDSDFTKIEYRYFKDDAIVEETSTTYTDGAMQKKGMEISWNHGMAEIISSLIENGLSLTTFREYDYSPYPCFKHIEEFEPGKYRIAHLKNKIPLVYLIEARKPLVP
jgi:SAM-dependent methyltransferase